MKNVYVLMYQGEDVQGVFPTMKSINQFFRDNEIPKEIREEEFEIIQTKIYQ
jgi:hypothetical protein